MVLSPPMRVSGTGNEPSHAGQSVREAQAHRERSIVARLTAVLACGGALLSGETAFAQHEEKSANHSTLRPEAGMHFSRATHDTGEGDAETIAHETADALAGRIEQPVMTPTRSSFLARWQAVEGASGYRLDVSTNPSFDSYVSSYRNLDIGNVRNFVVTNLKRGTTYYY